ncbi:hypothetical protein [Streptomyces sp. NPDC058664]|uniref:hypothetical protein n=1 Tax=unclassified Streptomyces TaxID=2593676 RepID=UPI003659A3AE
MKTDALTTPQRTIDTTVYDAVREAVVNLISFRWIHPDASTGTAGDALDSALTESRTGSAKQNRSSPASPGAA